MSSFKLSLIDEQIYNDLSIKHKDYIDLLRSHRTYSEAAEELGVHVASVSKMVDRILSRAAAKGIAPYAGMTKPIAEGFVPKRISTFYNDQGQVSRQWVIQEPERAKMLEMLKDLSAELLEGVEPVEPTPAPTAPLEDDLMINIPIGDAHIGMLSWEEETNDKYDLKIAKDLHCRAIDMLIHQTPAAKHCTIIDLGDFMHSDNLEGKTARSGNVLDMDSRYHKVVRVAIRIVLHYIQAALNKFEHVTFRPEIGNHNDVGSLWMQEMLAVVFANEPRVTIGNSAGNVFYWQHGDCYFMSHHGHQIKGDRLYQIFAKQIMDEHIATRHRKIYMGHVHHKSVTENAICEMETYRTLAGKDAYAAGGGYSAGRSITAETWHKKYGEVSKVNVTVQMLEDAKGE
tara:strand:- start:334 stop:1530 length:1197 start_codon:yes stop_codon:yes gene_type:complete